MESHPGGDTTQPRTTASQLQLAGLALLRPLRLVEGLPDSSSKGLLLAPVAQLAACPSANPWALSPQQLGAADSVLGPHQAAAGGGGGASGTAAAAAAGGEGAGWSCLSGDVLQQIFLLASTWQVPGSCLAAPVCRHWRAAAAGCSGIRLLYCAGHHPTDQSFIAWLGKNTPQLEALIISNSNRSRDSTSLEAVLSALAATATAAAAADGRALCLHTLRVLKGCGDLGIAAQLLQGLPCLHCLQLDAASHSYGRTYVSLPGAAHFLESLQGATQLQELCLTGFILDKHNTSKVAQQLPARLKRLSWNSVDPGGRVPNLSQLEQLSCLQLRRWAVEDGGTLSSRLPGGLRDLQLVDVEVILEVPDPMLLELREVLTQYHPSFGGAVYDWQQLASCTKLRFYSTGYPQELVLPDVCAAMQKLSTLSDLTLEPNYDEPIQDALTALHSFQALRRLRLNYTSHVFREAFKLTLSGLTQLTWLQLSCYGFGDVEAQAEAEARERAWAAEFGRMPGLRWLSVPEELLAVDQAWLGGMQQLQVLVLSDEDPSEQTASVYADLVEGLSSCSLPPRLRLLGLSEAPSEQMVSRQVRRQLQQRLGSIGCELVVGVDLDVVADPFMRLAGLPVELQQVLG